MTQNESQPPIAKRPDSACPCCDRRFVCDIAQGKDHCWCMNYPAVLPVVDQARCLCADCLSKAIGDAQSPPVAMPRDE